MEKLRLVLDKLRDARLTLKPSKCSLGATHIKFLGFVVGGGHILLGEGKTRAIHEYLHLQGVHAIRQFIELTGFF